MVHRHGLLSLAAILALLVVAAQDIALGEDDTATGGADIALEAHDARQRKKRRHRAHRAVALLHRLGLAAKDEQQGAAGAADVERFVVLVEDENVPMQHGAPP